MSAAPGHAAVGYAALVLCPPESQRSVRAVLVFYAGLHLLEETCANAVGRMREKSSETDYPEGHAAVSHFTAGAKVGNLALQRHLSFTRLPQHTAVKAIESHSHKKR